MSKITNDGLTRSGTGCFTAVPIWQWSSKGLLVCNTTRHDTWFKQTSLYYNLSCWSEAEENVTQTVDHGMVNGTREIHMFVASWHEWSNVTRQKQQRSSHEAVSCNDR